MKKGDIKKTWKKIWNFLWHEDSFASWVVSLLLAFIIVKFIIFPGLALALGTSLPLVVVESGSMHHSVNFDDWWDDQGQWYEHEDIFFNDAKDWPVRNGLDMGDIVVVSGRGGLELGDVIIFEAGHRYPIIHRVISIEEKNNEALYSTKGDNNAGQLETEKEIAKEDILGKSVLRIPKLGWVKLFFVKLAQAL